MATGEFRSTCIYPNRVEDRKQLEWRRGWPEQGNDQTEFFFACQLFARGYSRVVYGDHGPYLEFDRRHLQMELESMFGNPVDYDNLPANPRYYYFWLRPKGRKDQRLKVYLQLKTVAGLPNAPARADGKRSKFNRKEGYADYRVGAFYVDPYQLDPPACAPSLD